MRRRRFSYAEGPEIRSFGEFLAEIKRFASSGDYRVYFRGHGAPVPALLPSIGRQHYYLGRSLLFNERTEKNLLIQFRRHAYEHFGRIAGHWETLFLARHHGLPTRLLAGPQIHWWPCILPFFYESENLVPSAQRQRPGTVKLNLDGTIWAIQRGENIHELDVFNEKRSPLRIPGIKLVFPFNPTPRMTVQSGIFTLHGDPWTDMTLDAGRFYGVKNLDVQKLIKWTVRSSAKMEIILDLERLAINSRTLFPDLEGLAKGLWQTEIIRECFRGNRRRRSKGW